MIEKRELEFLLRAKKATYAGKGPEMHSSRPMSRDLEYKEDDLLYIDSYLGAEKFAGEEALWKDGKPFWGMNYCGRVIEPGFEGDFLKEALLNVSLDMPFRGPREYVKSDLLYKCDVNGDFKWFNGIEEIYKNGIKVYECIFHGGNIK